jgi:pseudouridine synthase
MARAGLASRRRSEELIAAGRVTVNGLVASVGQKVDPTIDRVEVDGIPLPLDPDLVYYLVNKPPGYLSTAADDRGRRTVIELVPSEKRVYPVGRLDRDSEGLLIVTNDGELTEFVTHPRHEVTKTYLARVRGVPSPGNLRRLTEGVELEDGPARAIDCRLIDDRGAEALVEVVMVEGRKREVRRMLAAIGHPVHRLVRTAIGPIKDRKLKPGAWRELDSEELRSLYRSGKR